MFNDAEVAWLKREIPKRPLHETVKLFNQEFDRDITYDQLRRANSRYKFGDANRKRPRLFNDAELAWLKRVISKWPMDKTVVRFNRKFNRDLTYEQLRDANHRYRLGRANVKHFHNPPDAPTIERPLGAERSRRLGGDRQELRTIMIKVPGPSPSKFHRTAGTQQKAHWMPKGRWVWEQANGPIPDGHVVAYLDGDPSNLDLDNLECVIRGAVSIVNMLDQPDERETDDAETRREKLLLAHARIMAGKKARAGRS
ncbi:MAG: HNH endonuclease signature motif containing protein [bacterium]|nr:HNH endonuclease signature motif containing protein [bacterium]